MLILCFRFTVLKNAADPKIANFEYVSRSNHYIVRFQIAMEDFEIVDVVERRSDLPPEIANLAFSKRTLIFLCPLKLSYKNIFEPVLQ